MTIHYRFLLDFDPARQIAWQHVEGDMRRASLSFVRRTYYRLVRPLLPLPLRQRLQSASRPALGDSWYLPDDFMKALDRGLESLDGSVPVIYPWPMGARFALVLTHDVESGDGLLKTIELADLEEELGFRSSFNLVPYKYKIDPGIVRELQARGFEIGIHGYNHDGRLYASRGIFDRRVPPINDALRRYGAVGFRSPMVHRNLQWLQALDIEYDCSCFDVDPLQPMPGGVGSIWPFVAGRFVELPYTLPQDHSLWIVLGQQSNGVWEHKLNYVAARHGMALMLTHPDYMTSPAHWELYREFLAGVKAAGEYWHALPRQAAAWWRQRDESDVGWSDVHGWTITGPARDRGIPVAVCVREGALAFEQLAVPSSRVSLTKELRGSR